MDWLTFFAEITKALAWPLSLVVIALIFKEPLNQLFRAIKSLKHGNLEFIFSKEIAEASAEAEEAGLTAHDTNTDSQQLNLVEGHPDLAIIKAWMEIEKLMRLISEKHEFKFTSVRNWTNFTENNNIVSGATGNLIRDLHQLHNFAAHQRLHPSSGDAFHYTKLAESVRKTLEATLNESE
jgi:hypothetical protein